MKVRLDFPFAGVLLIIAHLVGETLTYEPVGHSLLYNNQWVGSFGAILIPTLTIWQFVTSVQCTIVDPAKEMRAFASQQEKAVQQQRQPKIIKELTMLNRQSCLSKILCGVEVAKPPSSSSSTMNDYAFIVKSFFDVLSLGGRGKKKNGNQDDESPESDEEEEDDIESLSGSRRKNSKKRFSSNFGGEPDIEDTYSKDLEDLLKERDGFFKRRGRQYNLTAVENLTNSKLDRMTRGFLGNPRFDKTAFLNKKQLQIQQAQSDQEKLQIAGEVANKLQNPRQCRLLSWFRPSYTTTTTITTTSNEPSVSQSTVNSMCPFTVSELQAMIGPVASPQNVKNEEQITNNVQNQITKIVPLPKYHPKPAYQIFPKASIKTTPIPISVYGESDPDLELIKDPFYSLLPPEYAPPKEQQDEKYGNFYLNSDDASANYQSTQAPKKVLNATTTTTTTTTPKPVLTSEEEEEEDDIDDSVEENNDFEEHVQTHPNPHGHNNKGGGMRYMASTVGQSSRIRIRIPSKIHISIPSIRGIAANFRKDVQKPLNIPLPNPVDDNSDESPIERRETKRQTNFNHEKQLVFKTNLEFQDKIVDQKAPEFFVSKKKPLDPPPPIPPKQNYDDDDEDSEGEEEEEEERSSIQTQQKYSDDDSNEEIIPQKYESQSQKQSKPTTRRPLLSFNLPSILRSKTTTTTTTTQRPPPTKYSPSKNSTGLLRHVLSPHGMRTLSTITSMFYGSKQDEVHPHENAPPPPPPPRRRRKKGPKRHRRPRPKRPRPQHDQGDDEEEDDEDEESDESIETKPTPTIPPLVPVKMPPRIVAVPIYLEGKEAWEKAQDEEEFFEPKTKNKVKNKPEKYDYDESVETTNSGEGIDFGPGQGIQTEYSEIVDKVKRPGLHNPNSDRYVYGLPTTWEFMYDELKKQKNNQKNKESGNESDESGESGGNDSKPPRRKPPPPLNYYNRRPAASHYFPLEPID